MEEACSSFNNLFKGKYKSTIQSGGEQAPRGKVGEGGKPNLSHHWDLKLSNEKVYVFHVAVLRVYHGV